MKRHELPWREKTEVYICTSDKKILVQDHGKYLMFPGGGIDPTDKNVHRAAAREVYEETGVKLKGNTSAFRELAVVDLEWWPEWANNDKRKERYKEFRGERVHMLVYVDSSIQIPRVSSNDEEDAWTGKKCMSFDACIAVHELYSQREQENVATTTYRIAQKMAIEHARLLSLHLRRLGPTTNHENHKSRESRESRERYRKHLVDPWFTLVANSIKKVEGRLNKGDFAKLRIGDEIEFYNDDIEGVSRTATVTVDAIRKYKSFRAMLSSEGLATVLPLKEITSDKTGVALYRGFYSKEDEDTYGVLAIKFSL